MLKPPVVDYRKLRPNNINSPEFRHLKLLIFWPLFGLAFAFVEFDIMHRTYQVMHCALDDAIPFCEFFLIPYMFWFVYLIFPIVYTLLYDIDAFERMTKYTIITYCVTMLIYFIYPTCQELRPTEFARSNIFVTIVKHFYNFDTNTNVNPSLHVVGAVVSMVGMLHTEALSRTAAMRVGHVASAVLIIASTVFMKQHSVLDIPPALFICLAAYPIVYGKKARRADVRLA